MSGGNREPETASQRMLPVARFDSLAYFSSIGPTNDGRFKPDITAPGTSVSATPQ